MKETMYAVIFDTNSYRQFVSGKTIENVIKETKDLVRDEKSKNIQAYGSVIAGMEMLGNLSEGKHGVNFDDCLNGIIAMGHHCYDGPLNEPRILPHAYLLLANAFFDTVPDNIAGNVKKIGGVIKDLMQNHEEALEVHLAQSTFDEIKTYIDTMERDFSGAIITLSDEVKKLIKDKYPNINSKHLREKTLKYIQEDAFQPTMAIAVVSSIAQGIGISLTLQEIINRAYTMDVEFPLAAGFYRCVVYKIVANRIDMNSKTSKQKRWNWLWDYHVSIAVSEGTLEGREVIFVTSDQDLTDIIKDVGYSHKVMTIESYLNFLQN